MPAPGGNAQIAPAAAASPGAAGGVIPFQVGSYHYAEQISADVFQLSAASVATEFVHLITPGGFLRGVDLLLSTTTAGTTGVIANDFPWGGVPNISIENIDGSPILYPMPAYSYATWQRYCAPWLEPNPVHTRRGYAVRHWVHRVPAAERDRIPANMGATGPRRFARAACRTAPPGSRHCASGPAPDCAAEPGWRNDHRAVDAHR